jgi:heparinase II/III-like protein
MASEVTVAAPRRVFCVSEHRYRSRPIADEVVKGRFLIQGRKLDLGVEPDWLGASLPGDREWRLEWSKFYYGLDLAAAAEETRDARYAHAWQRLVLSWIAQVPVDADPCDVIGRRIQNWIYAWSRFAEIVDLDAVAPLFGDRLTASIADQTSYLERHLTRERNHRTLELYALFIVALSMPHLDAGGRLLEFALDALTRNLLDDVLPDGVQRERSTHYHHVVLRSFLGLRENARRYGLQLPPAFDARLVRACEFALHCHRPDGMIPALSDSDSGSHLDLLALAAGLFDRPEFRYAATRGQVGTPPRERMVSFPEGGYHIQRSGWGSGERFDAERFLIFDCAPIGDGGHGHYDALNVEIFADGRPLIVDPGRYSYCDEPEPWRRWFKGTAAHNTVTVDGRDQTPYRRGKPKSAVAAARFLGRSTSDRLDVLWGEVSSPEYDARHRRRILFVGDEYWLIEDTLDGAHDHRYCLRFHLTPEAQDRVVLEWAPDGCVMAPGVALRFAGHQRVTIEPGWVAYEYGIKRAAPIVAVAHDAPSATFVTLVAPRSAARPEPPAFRIDREGGAVYADVWSPATGTFDQIFWRRNAVDAHFTRTWNGSGNR